MKSVALALPVLFLAGCVAAPPLRPPEIQITNMPQLETEATADIGETLVAKGKLYVYDGLELQERITDNGIMREYIVEPNAMRLEREDSAGTKWFVASPGAYWINDKYTRRRAEPAGGYLLKKVDGSLELVGAYDMSGAGKITPAVPRHRVGKLVDRAQPNFRQELLYGGRIGNQIKLTYREFAGDLIRPGFTQEAQYDLAAEQVVGFKSVRIQVIDATNTRLKYKVLASFPDAP
jgi:hypothetical protein